jgi:hypothetical protein
MSDCASLIFGKYSGMGNSPKTEGSHLKGLKVDREVGKVLITDKSDRKVTITIWHYDMYRREPQVILTFIDGEASWSQFDIYHSFSSTAEEKLRCLTEVLEASKEAMCNETERASR